MDHTLKKISKCLYVDEDGTPYFSVVDFLNLREYRDTPEVRTMVVEDMKKHWPEVLILEEQLWHRKHFKSIPYQPTHDRPN